MDDERDVLRAWEAFTQRGIVPRAARSVVVASWQRSKQHQVTIDRPYAPLLTDAELFRHRAANGALVEAARPLLAQGRAFLREAGSMLILTDPAGLILETAGDPRARDFGHDIHLEQGGRWNERDIGTNAIGTAIASGQPVHIHAAEHFCSEVQRWTCAAAPIHHPADGKLLGILDISGPTKTFNRQSLAYAVAAGRQIEALLAQAIKADHERLLQHFVGKRALWPREEIVVIDSRGEIVLATGQALRELDRRHPGVVSDRRLVSLGSVPPAGRPVCANSCRMLAPRSCKTEIGSSGSFSSFTGSAVGHHQPPCSFGTSNL
jgi:transcriptional regulator of acetoin/glycerol metabolism